MRKSIDSRIKARIAETIVEEMLREAKYSVYRFGYESIIENLESEDRATRKDKVGMPLGDMPDLIALKDGRPYYIEVKFRKSGKLYPSEFTAWPGSRIMLVLPRAPYFRTSTYNAFKKTKKLYDLVEDRFLDIPSEIIYSYVDPIKRYLGGPSTEERTSQSKTEEEHHTAASRPREEAQA